MGLIIDWIEAEGFGSYKAVGRLNLGGRGPVAIVGANGGGKSTIASKAPTWCLWGKCAPERMGLATRSLSGNDIVADGCPEARVTVQLRDVQTGAVYTATRTKPRGKSDVLTLTRETPDGAVSTFDAPQAAIETLVGGDYDVWTRTVVRGQNDPWTFAEATDARKREIVDALSGACTLDVPYQRAREFAKEAERRRMVAERLLQSAQGRVKDSDVAHLEAQRDAFDATVAERVAAADAEVVALQAALADAKEQDHGATVRAAAREVHLRSRPVLDRGPYQQAEREASTVMSEAAGAAARAATTLQAVGSLQPGSACRTCGQIVQEAAPGLQQKAQAERDGEAAAVALREAQDHVHACRTATSAADAWLAGQVQRWQTELDTMPSVSGSRAPSVQAGLDAAVRRAADLRKGDNPFTRAVFEATAQRVRAEREVGLYAAGVASARHEEAVWSAWADALSPKGGRVILTDRLLAAIEVGANNWLGLLSNGRMSVEFEAAAKGRENIATKIHTFTADGTPTVRDLLTYSGGERARINLAVDLGVAAAASGGASLAVSLLVIDEGPVAGLDEEGKKRLVMAMHEAGVADVVLIDHDPRLVGQVPRIVMAARDADGYSVLTEGDNP